MPSRSIIRTGVGPHREPRNRFPAMAAAINLLARRAARVQSRRNLSRSLSPKLDHSHSITRFDRSRTGPKWLTRIWIRDREHDGQGMTGTSYRVSITPMIPGGKADDKNFRILESMPVRSIITHPANGARLPVGTREVGLRGAAWAGDLSVKQVDLSTDFGATWTGAELKPLRNRYDWTRWTAT